MQPSVSVKISLCSCFSKLLWQDTECFDAERFCYCYVEGLLLQSIETVESSLLNVSGKFPRFSKRKRFSQKSVNSFVLKIKGTILHLIPRFMCYFWFALVLDFWVALWSPRVDHQNYFHVERELLRNFWWMFAKVVCEL